MLCLLLLTLLAPLGCERNDEIRSYHAPKEARAVKPVAFTVPPGWREIRAQQMQYAAFAIDPDRSDASLSIVPLPREANELAPNVNRWEGQLGLAPSSPQAVQKMTTHLDVGDAHIDTVDLTGTDAVGGTGEPRRMLAAIVPYGTLTWFFTLKGPPDVVAAQQPNFDAFIRSLKFKADPGAPAESGHAQLAMAQPAKEEAHHPGDGHDHSDHAGHDRGAPQPAAEKINWSPLPAGWVEDPTPRQMRAHTLVVEADGKKGEVIVSRLPQNGVGDLLQNVNRWRGQVGLEPTKDPAATKPREMTVVGMPGFGFDFEGAAKDGQPARRQIVALTSQGNMFWFVRFVGPKELIDAQQKTFEKLLTDVRFAGAVSPETQPSTKPSATAQ